MSDSACDVVIAGAGPYGLSTAAHLRYLGLDVRIIGEPMRFWDANMPEGMYLKSEPFASSLGAPQEGLRFIDRHRGWRVGHPIPWRPSSSTGAGSPPRPSPAPRTPRS